MEIPETESPHYTEGSRKNATETSNHSPLIAERGKQEPNMGAFNTKDQNKYGNQQNKNQAVIKEKIGEEQDAELIIDKGNALMSHDRGMQQLNKIRDIAPTKKHLGKGWKRRTRRQLPLLNMVI